MVVLFGKADWWKYTLSLRLQMSKRLDVRTRGEESRVVGTSLHVTFLDYDNITDNPRLVEELQFLQEQFRIGNFYVFKTSKFGRHCICIDALTPKDQYEIIGFSSCDLAFKRGVTLNENRCWDLRFGKKGKRGSPEYAYTVESPYEGKNLQSRGHAKFLEKFGLKIDLKNPIGPEEIYTDEYNTKSKDVEE